MRRDNNYTQKHESFTTSRSCYAYAKIKVIAQR